ncbi:hypothetical protein A2U01_0073741, partial [Trifolium medium]|nr:hypothetical protein [Trifolium medium]
MKQRKRMRSFTSYVLQIR